MEKWIKSGLFIGLLATIMWLIGSVIWSVGYAIPLADTVPTFVSGLVNNLLVFAVFSILAVVVAILATLEDKKFEIEEVALFSLVFAVSHLAVGFLTGELETATWLGNLLTGTFNMLIFGFTSLVIYKQYLEELI